MGLRGVKITQSQVLRDIVKKSSTSFFPTLSMHRRAEKEETVSRKPSHLGVTKKHRELEQLSSSEDVRTVPHHAQSTLMRLRGAAKTPAGREVKIEGCLLSFSEIEGYIYVHTNADNRR